MSDGPTAEEVEAAAKAHEETRDLLSRRGNILIPIEVIAHALDLPDDVHLMGLTVNPYITTLVAHVVSKRLPKTPDMVEPPILASGFSIKQHVVTASHGDSDHPVEPVPVPKVYFRIEIDMPEEPTDG